MVEYKFRSVARTMLAGVSAAAIMIGSNAAASDYTFSVGFTAPEDIEFKLDNLGFASAVEGALSQRLEQVAALTVNSIAVSVDLSFEEIVRLEFDAVTDDDEWLLSVANRNIAVSTAGDVVAGGVQIANVGFNLADVTLLGDTGVLEITQEIHTEYYEIRVDATNLMFAGVAFGGTAEIDARMPGFEDVEVEVPVLDENGEPTGDFETVTQRQPTGEMVNGEQIASISLNTARIQTESDLAVFLGGQGIDGDYELEAFAMNAAIAFSPTPFRGGDDPIVRNLDQVAAVTVNSLSFRALEIDGEANADVYLTIRNSESAFEGDWFGQFASDDARLDRPGAFNLAVATTFGETAKEGFDAYLDFAGEDLDFAGEDNGGALRDALRSIENVFDSPVYGTWQGRDGYGDVNITEVSQLAALTLNAISYVGDGALIIDAELGQGEDGSFANNVFQVIDRLEGDNIGNMALAVTGFGDAAIDDLSQIISVQGNRLSSSGDLEFVSDAYQTSDIEIDGREDLAVAAPLFIQSIDYIELDRSQGFDAFGNLAVVGTENGRATTDGLEQFVQVAFNSIAAGGDIKGNFAQDVSSYDGGATANFNPAFRSDQEFEIANLVQILGSNEASGTGIDQTIVASLNSFSAGGEFVGVLDQHIHSDDENEFVNAIVAQSEKGTAISDSSQTLVLNFNNARVNGSVQGAIIQDVTLHAQDSVSQLNFEDYSVALSNVAYSQTSRGTASIDGLQQTLVAGFNTVSLGTQSGGDMIVRQRVDDELTVQLANVAFATSDLGVVGAGSADRIASISDTVQTAVLRVNTISVAAP